MILGKGAGRKEVKIRSPGGRKERTWGGDSVSTWAISRFLIGEATAVVGRWSKFQEKGSMQDREK